MGKYSAEEVRASVVRARAEALQGYSQHAHNAYGELCRAIIEDLNAFAERIEADERAVPACWRYYNSLGEVVSEWIDGAPHERHYSYPNNEDITDQITVECAFTHPPARAAHVDDKVVVIRDGKSTTQGLVLAAAIYMRAVKDVFALWPDGPPYNERKVTKDAAALRAFDHLDAATKALRSAISHFAPTAEPVAQGETSIPTVIDDLTFRLIEAIEERDHLRADLAAQPRAVPDANGHFWVAEPAVEVSNRHLAIAGVPSKYWDEARKAYALAATPSPPSNVA